MSAEDNKALVRCWFEELFNEAKLDLADEIVTPDHFSHDPSTPEHLPGPEGGGSSSPSSAAPSPTAESPSRTWWPKGTGSRCAGRSAAPTGATSWASPPRATMSRWGRWTCSASPGQDRGDMVQRGHDDDDAPARRYPYARTMEGSRPYLDRGRREEPGLPRPGPLASVRNSVSDSNPNHGARTYGFEMRSYSVLQ